jgi:hypothetical protein
MQAFLVMCDAAQMDQSTGKISMLGGDWAVMGPESPSMALVVFLRLSWEEIRQARPFALRLLDHDGQPVIAPIKGEEGPVQYAGKLSLNEASPIADDKAARLVDVHSSFTVNAPGLGGALKPGSRYTWSFIVEDEQLASVDFVVRPYPGLGETS